MTCWKEGEEEERVLVRDFKVVCLCVFRCTILRHLHLLYVSTKMLLMTEESTMTVLIVAHRLSTVRNADIIFVVQDGQVVEQGSHDDLLQNENGAYASLISRQMKAQKQLDA